MRSPSSFLVLLSAFAVFSVAHASTLTFTLSGLQTGTFQLSSTPTPDHVYPGFAEFDGVSVTNSNYGSPIDFYFETLGNGGGFADTAFINGFYGAQTFTGTQYAPVFAPGTFNLTSQHGSAETLTITSASSTPVAATPEPGSCVLLFTGLAAGSMVARRKGWMTQAQG